MSDRWNPEQYERFAAERRQPFFDLLKLIQRPPGGRVVDLGCGTGALTAQLHRALAARETLGVDSSAAMLAKAPGGVPGLSFRAHTIEAFDEGGWDVIFSNAALHWVDDHHSLIRRLVELLAPGGTLAVQMPSNHGHPSHTVAAAIAGKEPFRSALGGYTRRSPVLAPEAYAQLLARLWLEDLRVRLEVYVHRLESRDAVVEWVRGTLLTDYEKRLSPELFRAFLAAYRERLASVLPDERPFVYPFARVLLTGRKSALIGA